MADYLDKAGLTEVLSKIKTYVDVNAGGGGSVDPTIGLINSTAGSEKAIPANTATNMHTMTLPEGRWVVFGGVYYNNASSGSSIQTHLTLDGETYFVARQRGYAQANYDVVQEVSAPMLVQGESKTVAVVATSSVARRGTGRINAIKVK